ncbi:MULTISPECIES: S8 family peptidase [Halorussus]|uniref:S8 family peptidase n=1 Tax=Halorussus TaxID=1070314 RepID=UPI00209D069C|nr:S8 family peptidase [Halorussus vallis]USZ75109.1 S8 family peptidase [Halorussus vallis]
MTDESVSRRGLLASVGAGLVGTVGRGRGREASRTARYVVGTDSRAAARVAESHAAAVNHALDFGDVGGAVTGQFDSAAADALAGRDDVRYVEEGTTFRPLAGERTAADRAREQTVPWGVDRIDADVAHEAGHRGDGVDVAIVDSGILPGHPDLRENLGEGKAYVDCWADARPTCRLKPSGTSFECFIEVTLCATDWGDDLPNGHGTHVAGTVGAVDNDAGVLGVAPAASLHAVKVINAGGVARDVDIARAVKYVADRGWDVANLSFGNLAASRLLADACRYADERGVLLVAAAGNGGPRDRTVATPARFGTVLAVSATTRADRVAPFSSRGPAIDLAAPGADVCSTAKAGRYVDSGTSMAAPHVSGVGALLMADGYSHEEARERLRETAEDLDAPAERQGAGLVDAAAALDLDSDDDGVGRGVCHPAGEVPGTGAGGVSGSENR